MNRTRNYLCVTAAAVGVFALLTIANIGVYASNRVTEMLDRLGVHGMTVYAEDSDATQLDERFAACMKEMPEGEGSAAVCFLGGNYRAGGQSGVAAIVAGEDAVTDVMELRFLAGQGLAGRSTENSVVVSNCFAEQIYGRVNAVGRKLYLTIDGVQKRYEIIGVAEDQLGSLGGLLGNLIPPIFYVPLSCVKRDEHVDQVLFQTAAEQETAERYIRSCAIALGMDAEQLTVRDLSGLLQQAEEISGQAALYFAMLASISMLVALFGVENSMLSAVREMREEYLLYRVLGVQQRDVVRLVVTQSVLICLLGAGIGTVAAGGVALLLRIWVTDFTLSMALCAGILMLCLLLGLIAGLLPAALALRGMKHEDRT